MQTLRIFWVSILITLALAAVVLWHDGMAGLWLFTILVLLEVTFSIDNAVVNSKVLVTMSRFWQTIFLTVGIFIAVFVVRFLLPVFIVMVAGGFGFGEVIHLALNDAHRYGEVLHAATPMISAFGGAFLLMIGLSYFLDRDKDIHWLGWVERKLSRFGHLDNVKTCIMLLAAAALYFTVDAQYRQVVLISSVLGIALHLLLGLLESAFAGSGVTKKSATVKTGLAAFVAFMYLEVLDASFSLDGVIGAFAITSSVLLIIAGLGAGAIWVRSLTVYLMKTGKLAQYKYLEHGAHWAIMALGIVMMVKLYHAEPPEWLVGTLGIACIATAVVSSIIEKRRAAAAGSSR